MNTLSLNIWKRLGARVVKARQSQRDMAEAIQVTISKVVVKRHRPIQSHQLPDICVVRPGNQIPQVFWTAQLHFLRMKRGKGHLLGNRRVIRRNRRCPMGVNPDNCLKIFQCQEP